MARVLAVAFDAVMLAALLAALVFLFVVAVVDAAVALRPPVFAPVVAAAVPPVLAELCFACGEDFAELSLADADFAGAVFAGADLAADDTRLPFATDFAGAARPADRSRPAWAPCAARAFAGVAVRTPALSAIRFPQMKTTGAARAAHW
ncbi:MAG TPA: hypothetical protein VKB59_10145 [Micromonosporaceae bacterium]|nr:hypothetical protein [Micromonosporaceae bacterium]